MLELFRPRGSFFGATSLVFAACALIRSVAMAEGSCTPDIAEIRGDWGAARFRVEVADTPEQRSRGLMFRESLPSQSGMLFLFEQPAPVSFWMKNTYIPLDIIFISESGEVQHIHAYAKPGSLAPIRGGEDVLAVLEINGGMAARMGLKIGSEVRHPGLPQSKAFWPCD